MLHGYVNVHNSQKRITEQFADIQNIIDKLNLDQSLASQEQTTNQIRETYKKYQNFLKFYCEQFFKEPDNLPKQNPVFTNFIESTVKFDDSLKNNQNIVYGLIFIITSQKCGGNLLKKLNEFSELQKKHLIQFQKGQEFSIDKVKSQKDGIMYLNFPDNLFEKPIHLAASMNGKLCFTEPLTLLAHELIHIFHFLSNTDYRLNPFPGPPTSAHYQLYSNGIFADHEELITIEGSFENSEFHENRIREEYGLLSRKSHIVSDLNNEERFKRLSLLAQLYYKGIPYQGFLSSKRKQPNPANLNNYHCMII